MQTGERKWASARRGGMTVLGKVTAPKPINLPSQRLENHGQNRDVEIVPKGTVSWGSKSSPTPNAWGTSPPSVNGDGGAVSPVHGGTRPSSGGNSTRPSTAGSEITHEHNTNAWGANSRPSSASGPVISNYNSAVSLRPHSADTRTNSTQLSRFAEHVTDSAIPWNASATDKGIPLSTKNDRFSLSSGDFPSLGLDKESSGRTIDNRGDLPLTANGSSERCNTSFSEDGIMPNVDKWQAESQLYPNSTNQHHYDGWRGPSVKNHPAGVWYRPPPGCSPFGPPVAPGGFPLEPYSYYRPQVGPPLGNPRPIPGGSGPREMHPTMKDMYRPHIHDSYGRSAMPIRPGFYPGPYEGYYCPPIGYTNLNEREVQSMAMPMGSSAYNRFPAPFSHEKGNSRNILTGSGDPGRVYDSNFHDSSSQNVHVHSVLSQDTEEKVILKSGVHLGDELKKAELNVNLYSPPSGIVDNFSRAENWNTNEKIGEIDSPKVIFSDVPSQNLNVLKEATVKLKSPRSQRIHYTDVRQVPQQLPAPREDNLMQKVDGLNAKGRTTEGLVDIKSIITPEEQDIVQFGDTNIGSNESGLISLNPVSKIHIPVKERDTESATAGGSTVLRKLNPPKQGRSDHRGTGRLTFNGVDGVHESSLGCQEPSAESVVETTERAMMHLYDNEAGDSKVLVADPGDTQIQRATMLELAKVRLRQREKEEEERSRDQKAKAMAKLEELNRRTQGEGLVKKIEKFSAADDKNKEVESSSVLQTSAPVVTNRSSASLLGPKPKSVVGSGENIAQQKVDKSSCDALLELPKSVKEESVMGQTLSGTSNKHADSIRNKGSQQSGTCAAKPKGMGHMKKHNVPLEDAQVEKTDFPTIVGNATVYFGGVPVEISPNCDSSLPMTSRLLNDQLVTDKKVRNGKNKQKTETTASSVSTTTVLEEKRIPSDTTAKDAFIDSGRSKTPEYELDPASLQPSKHPLKQNERQSDDAHPRSSNQSKTQNSKRMARNTQPTRSLEKIHNGESVVWAPVRSHSKPEVLDDTLSKGVTEDPSQDPKNDHKIQHSQRNKRAEIERYVPKQVAREMHQGTRETSTTISHSTLEKSAEVSATGAIDIMQLSSENNSSNVDIKHGDGKHSKLAKTYGSWRKRGSTELTGSSASCEQRKDHQKSSGLSVNQGSDVRSVDGGHSSTGWKMLENAVEPKDMSRGKRQPNRGHKGAGYSHDSDERKSNGGDLDGGIRHSTSQHHQVESSVTSKDKRCSSDQGIALWQPKTQLPSISQEANKFSGNQIVSSRDSKELEIDLQPLPEKESSAVSVPSVPKASAGGNRDARRVGKNLPSKGRHGQPESSASSDEHDCLPETRKGSMESDKDYKPRNVAINKEKYRHNSHYEYQPVGSQSHIKIANNVDSSKDTSHNSVPKLKERNSNYSRRGSGHLYGRRPAAIHVDASNK